MLKRFDEPHDFCWWGGLFSEEENLSSCARMVLHPKGDGLRVGAWQLIKESPPAEHICRLPIWSACHKRPLPPPRVGMEVTCLLCARVKPWGTFDSNTGAVVCVDCRDAAYVARNHATASQAVKE